MPIFIKFTVACAYLATVILAVPLQALPRSSTWNHELSAREHDFLEPIRQAYKGIYWDLAFQNCESEDFKIILEATRMALQMTGNFSSGVVENVPAWNRYFVWDLISRHQWSVSPNEVLSMAAR
jgi:hypothetical protein